MPRRRPSRRLLFAAVVAVLVVAAGAVGFGLVGSRGPAPLLKAGSMPASERFERCESNALTKRLRTINARAERAVKRGEHGLSRGTVDAWLRTQDHTNDLIDAIRGHSKASRYDFMDLAFDDERGYLIEIAMRNHRHTAAIADCARRLHLFGTVRVVVHRWTPGQLDQAANRLNDQLAGKVDDELFETYRTYGDRYVIEVFRKATPDDIATIKRTAREIGVGFRLRRSKGDKPVAVPL